MSLFSKRRKFSFVYEQDIHAHILPGLDDGVQTMEEAVAIVTRMAKFGVKHLTCTPHVAFPAMLNDRKNIQSMLVLLKARLQEKGVEIVIDSGAEYKMGEFMLDLIGRDEILASDRGEVLIEHSFVAPSVYFDEIVFKLQNKGYQPILAHPERYPFYAKDIVGYCRGIQEKGCKIQVNWLSFTGYYGKEAMRGIRKLYNSGCVDYYAGDIHNLHQEMLLEKFIEKASS